MQEDYSHWLQAIIDECIAQEIEFHAIWGPIVGHVRIPRLKASMVEALSRPGIILTPFHPWEMRFNRPLDGETPKAFSQRIITSRLAELDKQPTM
jgi:hypothetical protein